LLVYTTLVLTDSEDLSRANPRGNGEDHEHNMHQN
jgi:hypothetical protein